MKNNVHVRYSVRMPVTKMWEIMEAKFNNLEAAEDWVNKLDIMYDKCFLEHDSLITVK